MVILDDLRVEMVNYRKEMIELSDVLNLKESEKELEDLKKQIAADGFWDDLENSQKILQKTKTIENKIGAYNKLNENLEDIIALIELSIEAEDDSSLDEINRDIAKFKTKLEDKKLSTLLTGEYDKCNAILTFHAGAGGTEAQDWAEMLYRMYNRWAERHSFKVSLLDYLDGDDAGLKSASILIEGENAYGYMKSEAGVHRLVRISPFDASGRRHTSFAALEVMPEIDDSTEVDIRPEDLQVDAYRASGAGGQHINKTSSAVRMTHIPTGIVAACQNERSQFQNKEQCLRLLKAKLFELEMQKREQVKKGIEGEQQAIEWGSQIRSYVFQPYTLVKDNRTGIETGNIQSVMDGGLNPFIEGFLKHKKFNNA